MAIPADHLLTHGFIVGMTGSGKTGLSTSYIPWAELLKRSVEFDVLKCPNCKGRMAPIAVITRPKAIERILSHLSLPIEMEVLGTHGTMACDNSDEQIPEAEWSQISQWEWRSKSK